MKERKYDISRRGMLKFSALGLLGALAAGGVPGAAAKAGAADNKFDSGKALVVYYSRTGNTRAVANFIQQRLNCAAVELQVVNSYPEEYRATTEQAKQEQERGYRPPLKNSIDNINAYDVILLGSPCWWGTVAMPVFTFLDEYDLSGKTICPFMTHEGSGLGRSVEDISRLCSNSTIAEGLAIRGGLAQHKRGSVYYWLDKLGFAS